MKKYLRRTLFISLWSLQLAAYDLFALLVGEGSALHARTLAV